MQGKPLSYTDALALQGCFQPCDTTASFDTSTPLQTALLRPRLSCLLPTTPAHDAKAAHLLIMIESL